MRHLRWFRPMLTALVLIPLVVGTLGFAETIDNIRQSGKLRIAVDLGNYPWGLQDENLQPGGIDVDVGRLIAESLGVELEVVETTGPNRIPFLVTDKADLIISTLAKTPEREEVIDYTDMPYSFVIAVVGAPASLDIHDWSDLAGKRVGVVRNTTNDTDATDNAKGATIVRFDDEATLVTALVTGQVDAVAQSGEMVAVAAQRNPGMNIESKFVVRRNDFGIGVRKDNPETLAWLNQWLSDNFDNGNLNQIQRKYLSFDLPDDFKSTWK